MGNKLERLSYLLIAVIGLAGCRAPTEQIGETVKASMQQTFDSDPSFKSLHITVESVAVVRAGGNSYQGLARVRSGNQSHDISVKITADGKNIVWQTEPGALLAFSMLSTPTELRPTESLTDKAIRITQEDFKFRANQPEAILHGTWTAIPVPIRRTSPIDADFQLVLVHYSVPSLDVECGWTLGFPLADPHAYSLVKADECVKQRFEYATGESFGSNGQPMLPCQDQFGEGPGGLRDYYRALIAKAYGSAPMVSVAATGDDTSSPSFGCVASFQFRKANSTHVAKWVIFPNESQGNTVAVSADACDLDERRVLVEDKWQQNPCVPQFSADVSNPRYSATKIIQTVSAGQSKCKAALASDLKGHAQSVADLYCVQVSTDLSPVGDPDSDAFRCSLVEHVPEYNGNVIPDRIAHWALYPNRNSNRIMAVNPFACDVEAKRAPAHPDEMPIPCAGNQFSNP